MARVTVQRLRQVLTYDPRDGKLYWRDRGIDAWDVRFADTVAGTVTKEGYIHVSVDNVDLPAHVVAWAIHYGAWPPLPLDHKDTNGTNNRIVNLRLASGPQNGANARLNSRNTSGHKGVTFDKTRGRYRAQIMCRGKKMNLGRFSTAKAAAKVYDAAAKRLFGEFARTNSDISGSKLATQLAPQTPFVRPTKTRHRNPTLLKLLE